MAHETRRQSSVRKEQKRTKEKRVKQKDSVNACEKRESVQSDHQPEVMLCDIQPPKCMDCA